MQDLIRHEWKLVPPQDVVVQLLAFAVIVNADVDVKVAQQVGPYLVSYLGWQSQ